MTDEPAKPRSRREEIARRAAALGGLLGLLCHLVPSDYQTACSAVAKATSLIGGGCS